MITPVKLNMVGIVATAFLAITARQNIFDAIMLAIWHYYALKIADLSRGSRAEYF